MPRIDQYRVRLEICPLAKASHWGDLRRQGRFCLRRESGDLLFRQNVASEWSWRCSTRLGEHAMTIFCVVSRKSESMFPWPGGAHKTVWLNKRTGCKSPRCRHCKCRDGLPLVKASHWRIPRRQTGQSLETQVRRPTEIHCGRFAPELGRKRRFAAQKNGCGGLLF